VATTVLRDLGFSLLWLSLFVLTGRHASAGILPVDQAFRLAASVDAADGDAVFTWDIADGYHLYRQKFQFLSRTTGADLGAPMFPEGEKTHDEFFGEMESYRSRVEIHVPVVRQGEAGERLDVEVGFQGCADEGICYPPQRRNVSVTMPLPGNAAVPARTAGTLGDLAQAFRALGAKSQLPELLPADQAFRFFGEPRDPSTIRVGWQIADGYYLYREKFKVALLDAGDARLGNYEIPRGEPRQDEEFGAVEIFHREVGFELPLIRGGEAQTVRLRVNFQGCADRGVCYPPMEKEVSLSLPAVANITNGTLPPPGALQQAPMPPRASAPAEQDRIAAALKTDSLGLTVLSFLGFGVLLAFTPCIFPMIPILSGIIVGHGDKITTGRAFVLSLSYVLASSATYTLFGVLAGLFGSNLQAMFQEPWVIVSFSILFVLLALSMFGFYQLQLPTFVQSRIAALSSKQKHGTVLGAGVMGALSALIVGPCVAAPLAGAFIYIGQTGDAWLGGLALFALGLGMGIPLLILGASAGSLLPRAGLWMNAVKAIFGVGLLAVAIWLLGRIAPMPVVMFLWALLLIIPAIYLGAVDALPLAASGWRKLWKGVGIVMLTYGILLLAGVATDSDDPLQPLRGVLAAAGKQPERGLAFQRVSNSAELERRLADAQAQGHWVMLDFYADWCVSCKEMERYTFGDPDVKAALADLVLLQADVTANSPDDQGLLKQFGLIGPPATLFFGPDRGERPSLRVVGYMNAQQFLHHLGRLPSCVLEC